MKRNLEIWHRITKDLKIEELEKPDLSLIKTTKYWIKGVLSGRTNTTSANNTFEHYDYQIYNEYQTPPRLQRGVYGYLFITKRYVILR